MRLRLFHLCEIAILLSISNLQLLLQMTPFIQNLAASARDRFALTTPNLPLIEFVTSARSFGMNAEQIFSNTAERILTLFESLQLRVVPVTLRRSSQHFLGEQCFSPHGQ